MVLLRSRSYSYSYHLNTNINTNSTLLYYIRIAIETLVVSHVHILILILPRPTLEKTTLEKTECTSLFLTPQDVRRGATPYTFREKVPRPNTQVSINTWYVRTVALLVRSVRVHGTY